MLIELINLAWRKSCHSSNEGQCVEVAEVRVDAK